MTRIPVYQVDAFSDRAFGGNPAAVCPLDDWLPDQTMQAIGMENNLSETAFFRPRTDGDFDLRWFTPVHEVDLCGHATLASGHVVLRELAPDRGTVTFHTRSGALTVTQVDDRLLMDFPAWTPNPAEIGDVSGAIGVEPEAVFAASYAMAILKDERAVRAVEPDHARIRALTPSELIVTAPGDDCDFVSRFFAPAGGIDEDPVTGSAHCLLTPYWADRLSKNELHARQVSARGGELWCAHRGDRVEIAGHATPVMVGEFQL